MVIINNNTVLRSFTVVASCLETKPVGSTEMLLWTTLNSILGYLDGCISVL